MTAIQEFIKWFQVKHIFPITDEGQDMINKVYELAKDEPLMYTQAEVDKIKHDAYNKGWNDTVNEYGDVNCVDLDNALDFAEWFATNDDIARHVVHDIWFYKGSQKSKKELYLIYINSKG